MSFLPPSDTAPIFPNPHRIGFSAGEITPPPLHHERCLREPITIQRRRRNCTDGSVLFVRRYFEFDSQVFLVTHPKTVETEVRWGQRAISTREIYFALQDELPHRKSISSISHDCVMRKRNFLWTIPRVYDKIVTLAGQGAHATVRADVLNVERSRQ